MPNDNENEPKSQNLPPDENEAAENGAESNGSKKGFFSTVKGFFYTVFVIFRNFFPALLAAFAIGRETFKRRVQGASAPENKEKDPEDGLPGRPGGFKSLVDEDNKDEEDPVPPKPPGFFKAKLASFKQKIAALNPSRKPAAGKPGSEDDAEAGHGETEGDEQTAPVAGSGRKKIILALSIVLITLGSVCGGLYLGGIFDGDSAAAGAGSTTAPPKNTARAPQKSFFDSIFGKKIDEDAPPREKLAAMHITYNANNFVRYAGQNDLQVVNLFIEAGMHPDIGRPIDGFTPLMAAASFDRPEIAEFLLQKGATINEQDNEGQTALMKAVRHNRPYMVELLLKNQADFNITDKSGNTAVSLAKEYYVDNRITEIFANFDVNLAEVKKAPDPEKALDSVLPPPTRAPAPPPPPDPGQNQPRRSPYLEISVVEFLKMLEPKPPSQD